MALFNLKKPQPKQETEEIQTILPNPSEEIIPELNPEELSEISELLEIPEATEEIPAEAAPAEEKPKKKSILTMDLKDLFKSKKKKEQDDDDEDEDEEEKQPKKSILTMDLKDLVKLKPASKKGAVKRSKRTMNFVHHQRNFNLMKVLPPVLVAVAALIIFVRVGFLDMLDKKTLAYDQLARKQEQLAAINTRLVGYDELAAKFGRYSYGWMSVEEISTVNRLDVLQMIEEEIAPNATIESFSVSGNSLTMNIFEITLEEASTMVKHLEAHELVAAAVIYSANAPEATDASIFLSITLMKEAGL